MKLSRRALFGLAAAVGGGAALSACSGSPAAPSTAPAGLPSGGAASASTAASAAAQAATIGLTYIPNVQFSPFYVAEAAGDYDRHGVAATLRHHGASEALFTAIAAGQEQFVVAGADEMLQARSQGMDLVAIAQHYHRYPVVLIVPDASPIKTAADLKGRSVGVPGKYGESWFGLKVLLKGAGLAESDVTITEIGYTQQAALVSKRVDSIIGFSNNDVVAFAAAGVAVRSIPLLASGTPPLVSICLITTQAYADAHPDVVKGVVAATTEGFRAAAADPAAALDATTAYVSTLKSDAAARDSAAKTLAASIAVWKDASGQITPAMDPAQFAAMATFMNEQGLLAKAVDPAGALRNAYQS